MPELNPLDYGTKSHRGTSKTRNLLKKCSRPPCNTVHINTLMYRMNADRVVKFVSWSGVVAVPLTTLACRRELLCAASCVAAQGRGEKLKLAVAFGSQEPARCIELTTSIDGEGNATSLASSSIMRYLKRSGRFKFTLYTPKSRLYPARAVEIPICEIRNEVILCAFRRDWQQTWEHQALVFIQNTYKLQRGDCQQTGPRVDETLWRFSLKKQLMAFSSWGWVTIAARVVSSPRDILYLYWTCLGHLSAFIKLV